MQTGREHKVAILLHGPTAVGKTAVGRVLLGGMEPVLLDAGWGTGSADWPEIERRALARKIDVAAARLWYDRYAAKDELVTLPNSARITEIPIGTTGRSPLDVANAIGQIVATKRPFVRLADVL